MRQLPFFIAACFILLGATAQAETRFFPALPDIPVAEALTPLPDQATIFDKPAGRFIQAVALVAPGQTQESILHYYETSLPAFGWKPAGQQTYKRRSETLKFWLEDFQGETYFYISIEP